VNCCRQCFEDGFLKEYIQQIGIRGNCDYCGAEDEFVINAVDLADLFQRFTDLYKPSDEYRGDPLANLLAWEWGLFNDELVTEDKHAELLQEIMRGDASEEDLLDVPCVTDLWVENLPDPRLVERWDEFAKSLRERPLRARSWLHRFLRRVFHRDGPFQLGHEGVLVSPHAGGDTILNDPFVWVSDDLSHVAKTIHAGTKIFRARLRYRKENDNFAPLAAEEMGTPPPEKATAGRANPEGTSVLYCAEEEATAIAEVRPARGQLVSIAAGETMESLNILDFAEKVRFVTPFACEHLPSLVQSYELFNRWGDELARPLRHNDDVSDYFPTQYLAQWVRTHHYDGIRYPSALAADGHNLVIFERGKVRFTGCRLVEIKSVSIQYGDLEPEG
jgi:RES domain